MKPATIRLITAVALLVMAACCIAGGFGLIYGVGAAMIALGVTMAIYACGFFLSVIP